MRAMVLDEPRKPLVERELPDPDAGHGTGGDRGVRVRRLPHGPPHSRRRADRAQASTRPRPPGGRPGDRGRGRREPLRDRRPGGCPVARLDVRSLPLLPLGRENLCERAKFTGYDLDGGLRRAGRWPTSAICFPLPGDYPAEHAAPLLCAGLIGYRALRLAGEGERLGLYGFGSSAHIICQVAVQQGRRVFAFTRAGDSERRSSPASWAPSGPAPSARPARAARRGDHLRSGRRARFPRRCAQWRPGGTVVCAGIHMSDIPSLPVRDPLGRADSCAPSPTSPAPTARSSCPSRRACPSRRRSRSIRWRKPIGRWTTCVTVG